MFILNNFFNIFHFVNTNLFSFGNCCNIEFWVGMAYLVFIMRFQMLVDWWSWVHWVVVYMGMMGFMVDWVGFMMDWMRFMVDWVRVTVNWVGFMVDRVGIMVNCVRFMVDWVGLWLMNGLSSFWIQWW